MKKWSDNFNDYLKSIQDNDSVPSKGTWSENYNNYMKPDPSIITRPTEDNPLGLVGYKKPSFQLPQVNTNINSTPSTDYEHLTTTPTKDNPLGIKSFSLPKVQPIQSQEPEQTYIKEAPKKQGILGSIGSGLTNVANQADKGLVDIVRTPYKLISDGIANLLGYDQKNNVVLNGMNKADEHYADEIQKNANQPRDLGGKIAYTGSNLAGNAALMAYMMKAPLPKGETLGSTLAETSTPTAKALEAHLGTSLPARIVTNGAKAGVEMGLLNFAQTGLEGGSIKDELNALKSGAASGAIWGSGGTVLNAASKAAAIKTLKFKGYEEMEPNSGIWINKDQKKIFFELTPKDAEGKVDYKYNLYKKATEPQSTDTGGQGTATSDTFGLPQGNVEKPSYEAPQPQETPQAPVVNVKGVDLQYKGDNGTSVILADRTGQETTMHKAIYNALLNSSTKALNAGDTVNQPTSNRVIPMTSQAGVNTLPSGDSQINVPGMKQLNAPTVKVTRTNDVNVLPSGNAPIALNGTKLEPSTAIGQVNNIQNTNTPIEVKTPTEGVKAVKIDTDKPAEKALEINQGDVGSLTTSEKVMLPHINAAANNGNIDNLSIPKAKSHGMDRVMKQDLTEKLVQGLNSNKPMIDVKVPRDGHFQVRNDMATVTHLLNKMGVKPNVEPLQRGTINLSYKSNGEHKNFEVPSKNYKGVSIHRNIDFEKSEQTGTPVYTKGYTVSHTKSGLAINRNLKNDKLAEIYARHLADNMDLDQEPNKLDSQRMRDLHAEANKKVQDISGETAKIEVKAKVELPKVKKEVPQETNKNIVYHGTNKDFKDFDSSQNKNNTLYGGAFYFTDSLKSAEKYSSEYHGNTGTPRAIKATLNYKKLWDFNNDKITPEQFEKAFNYDGDYPKITKPTKLGQLEGVNNITDGLQKLGYDGFKIKEKDGSNTFAVFKNEQINQIQEPLKASTETPKKVTFSYSKDEIPYEISRRSYSAISFDPERMAELDQREYVNAMKYIENKVNKLVKNDEQIAIANTELARYKEKYLSMYKAIISARSKTMSAAITGPAKFPTVRNQKAVDAEHKRTVEFLEWQKKAENSLLKKIEGADDTPVFDKIKKDLDFNIETIIELQNGKGYGDISLFRSSLVGKLKRIADNGDLETFNKGLDYIKLKQKESGKTILANNNSLWTYGEKAKASIEKKEEVKNNGNKTIKEYEGATILNNYEEDRTQITMDEKPSKDITTELSKSGWHFSFKNKAWQRKITANAEYSARKIMDKFYKEKAGENSNEKGKQEQKSTELAAAATKELKETAQGHKISSARGKIFYTTRLKGLSFNQKLIKDGKADLIGEQITTPKDLAVLAQAFRDPRYETLRYVYVKDGKIAMIEGVTCKIPNMAVVSPSGHESEATTRINENMAKLKADGYYMLHNHPSGVPTPSNEDISTTKNFNKATKGLIGHVIINSNRYGIITPSGKTDVKPLDLGEDKLLKPSIENENLDINIFGGRFAQIAKKVQKSNRNVVIYANADLKTRAIEEVPLDYFDDYKKSLKFLNLKSRNYGSPQIFLVTPKANDTIKKLVKQGYLVDAIENGSENFALRSTNQPNMSFIEKRDSVEFFGEDIKGQMVKENSTYNITGKTDFIPKELSKQIPVEGTVYRGRSKEKDFYSGSGRYGEGTYYATSKRAAEIYAKDREEGQVDTVKVKLNKPFVDSLDIDKTTPEFKKLNELLKEEGLNDNQITFAFNQNSNNRFNPYERIRQVLVQSKDLKTKNFWNGADEVNSLIRKAGYDGIIGEYQNDPDFPDHLEVVKFNEPSIVKEDSKQYEANLKVSKEAQKYFGTTSNFKEAGYLTIDGKLLDFSGKKFGGNSGERSMDHREISDMNEYEGPDMEEFMNMGNIRMKPESDGFELALPPTPQQTKVLKTYIARANGEVYVDLGYGNYHNSAPYSLEYNEGTKTSKIFDDIDSFYKPIKDNPDIKLRDLVDTYEKNHYKSELTEFLHEDKAIYDSKDSLSLLDVNKKIITLVDQIDKIAPEYQEMAKAELAKYKKIKSAMVRAKVKNISKARIRTLLNNSEVKLPQLKQQFKDVQDYNTKNMQQNINWARAEERYFADSRVAHEVEKSRQAIDFLRKKIDSIQNLYSDERKTYIKAYHEKLTEYKDMLAHAIKESKVNENWARAEERIIADMRVAKKDEQISRIKANFVKKEADRKAYAAQRKEEIKAKVEKQEIYHSNLKVIKKAMKDVEKLRPEFRDKIKPILESIQLSKPTEATMNKILAMQEYFNRPENEDDFIPPKVAKALERLGKTPFSELSEDEQSDIVSTILRYEALNALKNKLIYGQKVRELKEVKFEATKNLNKAKPLHDIDPFNLSSKDKSYTIGPVKKFFTLESTDPEVLAQKLDGTVGSTLKNDNGIFQDVLYQKFSEGFNKQLSMSFDVMDGIRKAIGKTKIQSWDNNFVSKADKALGKKVDYVKLTFKPRKINGKMISPSIEMTKAERMSLYAHSFNVKNINHLVNGGFSFESKKDVIIDWFTYDDLKQVIDSMTQEEKRIADYTLKEVFNGKIKNEVNAVSLRLNFSEIANEENYFPIEVNSIDRQHDYTKPRNSLAQQTLEGMGCLKERIGSQNAILIKSFFKVTYDHTQKMSIYCGLAEPLRNARMVLGDKEITVKIMQNFGKDFYHTLQKYLDDVESQSLQLNGPETIWLNVLHNVQGALLKFNPTTAVKQFIGYFALAPEVEQKYITKAAFMKNDDENMYKYCPQFRYRRFGNVDREEGEIASVGTLKKEFTGKKAATAVGMEHIEWADFQLVKTIWNVSRAEISHYFPGLKGDEYYKKVAERATEVLNRVQPSRLPINRSEIGRTTSLGLRMLTSFASEPNKMFNQGQRSFLRYASSKKGFRDRSHLIRSLLSIFLFTSIAEQGVSTLRDIIYGRKIDTFSQGVMSIFTNVLGNFYGVGPVARAVQSKVRYGSFASASLDPLSSAFGQFADGIAELATVASNYSTGATYKTGANKGELKWEHSIGQAFLDTINALAMLKGIPAKNVENIVNLPSIREKNQKKNQKVSLPSPKKKNTPGTLTY